MRSVCLCVCLSASISLQPLDRSSRNYYADPILSRLCTKVRKIFRRCRKALVLSNALLQFSVSRFVQKIFAVSFRRYLPLSLEIVEDRSKCKSFLPLAPNFCERDGSDFVRQFVRATDYRLLGKVWLSSVC